MNPYEKYILPLLLSRVMGSSEIEQLRPEVIADAWGAVLEIGSGPGFNFPLYRNVTKLYALEPSQELIEMSRGKVEGLAFPVEFLHAFAEKIPLPDASVDTVVSTWTLCSMENPVMVLQEIKRVLKPGGKFVFIDHGLSPKPFLGRVQKTITPVTKHFTGNCHMDRDIEKLVREAGFTISKLKQFQEKSKPLMFNTQGVAVLV